MPTGGYIIIGAGHNGLLAACTLAASWLKGRLSQSWESSIRAAGVVTGGRGGITGGQVVSGPRFSG
jgi:hypothetical protein